MKASFSLPSFRPVFFLFCLCVCLQSHSQISIGACGSKPYRSLLSGAGAAFTVFSAPLNLHHNLFELRFGGGFSLSQLESKTLGHVPLELPAQGFSTVAVKNHMYELNAIARLSFPYSKTAVPYIDVYTGLKNYTCRLDIVPENQAGHTPQHVMDTNQFNAGVAGGIIISLSRAVKLDVGIGYSCCPFKDKMIDVQSARLESGAIVLDRMNTPLGMTTVKAGLVFSFNNVVDGVAYTGPGDHPPDDAYSSATPSTSTSGSSRGSHHLRNHYACSSTHSSHVAVHIR